MQGEGKAHGSIYYLASYLAMASPQHRARAAAATSAFHSCGLSASEELCSPRWPPRSAQNPTATPAARGDDGVSSSTGVYESQRSGGKEKALTEKDDEPPAPEENCFTRDFMFQQSSFCSDFKVID